MLQISNEVSGRMEGKYDENTLYINLTELITITLNYLGEK